MENGKLDGITLAMLAEKSGGKYNTVWRKAKRLFPAETWTKESVLSADHIRVLSGKSAGHSAVRPAKKSVERKPAEVVPVEVSDAPNTPQIKNLENREEIEPPTTLNFRLRRLAFNAVCLSIIVGHAGLIWYDCAELWQVAGTIAGGVSFLFVLGCVLVATDETRTRTSGAALWIIAAVDFAAWWVHYPVFSRESTQYGMEYETGALCAAICALSFAALYLYRDEKID